jgi:hypothetical protein
MAAGALYGVPPWSRYLHVIQTAHGDHVTPAHRDPSPHALGDRAGLPVDEELRRRLRLGIPPQVGKSPAQRAGLIEALDDAKLTAIGKPPGHRLLPPAGR